jgi:predicted TIM-barrel fold metal-dependent hydrolase
LAQAALREYNDWVVRQTSLSPDRIRPVPYLWHGSPLDDLIEETASLIARGVKAVHVSCGAPTAGRSPADPALDPFWNLLEQNDVPLLFHVGHGSRFLDPIWGQNVPAFARGKVESIELGSTPYPFFSMHHAPQNYIAVMVLGGVFERFPRLRLGVIELGAAWFGPFAAHLDMWADKVYRARFAPFLSMAPSEYLARNVRVTPFNTFESVQDYIAAYPRLADCYCFSTDYPHVEGGRHSLRENQARLSTLGPEVVEGFFVRNAQWILP